MIRPILLSASVAGLLAGHFAGYLAAVPSEASRHSVLAGSGHAYLGSAVVFGLLAALTTLAGSIWLGYRYRPLRVIPVALRLAIIQVPSYFAMELAERWIAGGSFDRFALLLALGLVAQVAVAFVAAAIIVALAYTGKQIRELTTRAKKRIVTESRRSPESRPILQSELIGYAPIRGPPQPRAT